MCIHAKGPTRPELKSEICICFWILSPISAGERYLFCVYYAVALLMRVRSMSAVIIMNHDRLNLYRNRDFHFISNMITITKWYRDNKNKIHTPERSSGGGPASQTQRDIITILKLDDAQTSPHLSPVVCAMLCEAAADDDFRFVKLK